MTWEKNELLKFSRRFSDSIILLERRHWRDYGQGSIIDLIVSLMNVALSPYFTLFPDTSTHNYKEISIWIHRVFDEIYTDDFKLRVIIEII